jgi:hypothetical protein
LINLQHWNNDFYDNQTMCKPKIMLCKPKSVMCNLFSSICKARNFGDSEEFLQGSLCPHLIFTGLIISLNTFPTFLVQSVDVTFSGQNKVKMVCAGLHPDAPRWSLLDTTAMCSTVTVGPAQSRHGACPVLLIPIPLGTRQPTSPMRAAAGILAG